MPMVTSQILKSVDFTKTQKSWYPKNKRLFFLQIKKNKLITHKGLKKKKKKQNFYVFETWQAQMKLFYSRKIFKKILQYKYIVWRSHLEITYFYNRYLQFLCMFVFRSNFCIWYNVVHQLSHIVFALTTSILQQLLQLKGWKQIRLINTLSLLKIILMLKL